MILILLVSSVIYNRRVQRANQSSSSSSTSLSGTTALSSEEIKYSELRLGERIGRGSTGEVYCGIWRHTRVAIKVLPTHVGHDKLLKEANLMKSLRHPNVVQVSSMSIYLLLITLET